MRDELAERCCNAVHFYPSVVLLHIDEPNLKQNIVLPTNTFLKSISKKVFKFLPKFGSWLETKQSQLLAVNCPIF